MSKKRYVFINVGYVAYFLLLLSSHVFSAEEVRQIYLFEPFNSKWTSEGTPIMCYMTKEGNLLSSETGITYELSAKHLAVIGQDASEVIGATDGRLRNDYYMGVVLQEARERRQTWGMRVTVDYHCKSKLPWHEKSEEERAISIQQFLSEVATRKNQNSTKGEVGICNKDWEIGKGGHILCMSNVKYTFGFVAKSHYPTAQFIAKKDKIILTDNTYNNERIRYTGSIDVDYENKRGIVRGIHYSEDKRCYVQVALSEDKDINIWLEVTRPAEDVVQAINIIGPESFCQEEQKEECTVDTVTSEKETSNADEKITQDSQGTWPQLLLLPCGIAFCVAAFLLYRYRNT